MAFIQKQYGVICRCGAAVGSLDLNVGGRRDGGDDGKTYRMFRGEGVLDPSLFLATRCNWQPLEVLTA